MNANFRWLVSAAVILVLAYLAVTHDRDIHIGPGSVRIEQSNR